MKRIITILVAALLVFTACGDDDSIASADSCDGLVDQGLDLFQDTLDALSDMSLEEMAEFADEPPAAIQDLETRGQELEARSDELGCTEEELQEAMLARVDELSAEGPVAEFLLQTITQGVESGSLFGG